MINCIREKRAARGLTQAELGKALGVTPFTIIRWEKGYTAIPFKSLERLARFLQVAPHDLLPGLACIPELDEVTSA